MENHQNQVNTIKKDKVIIIGLFIDSPCSNHSYQINELEQLVNTLGGVVIDKMIQYRKNIDPKFYRPRFIRIGIR